MTNRIEVLKHLIDLRLRADADDRLNQLYQFALRDARLDREEFDYIDYQVNIARAMIRVGAVPKLPIAGPGLLPSRAVIEALQGSTPLARIYHWVNKIGCEWNNDARRTDKAYVMACFSEAAYLHLASHELLGRDRYKIFPSTLLLEMLRRRWRVNLTEVLSRVADVPVQVVETGQFVYMIYRLNTLVVIAVRGTVSPADWGINLNAFMTRKQERGYHRGFFKEAMQAYPLLTNALSRMNLRPDTPLYFTGHSLGGAVASILARVWNGPPRVMVPYVFASPRFAALFIVESAPPFGYVAPDDLVPHLPPRLFGYADAGLPPELVPSGMSWLSGLRTLISWLTPGRGFWKPHSIERYRSQLGEQVGEQFPDTVYVDALNHLAPE